MVGASRLAALALLLAAGTACRGLHSLAPYYADTGDTSGDTGGDSNGDSDSGPVDTDTGPIDTDTGPVDTDTGSGGDTVICNDNCFTSFDGECDDGGPGSLFSICSLGTDCADCGPRTVQGGCNDSCTFSADGWCDDGGPNSETDWCTYATDCTDCGPR